jgi:glycyl-tRNA synthetase alpha chain
LTFQDLVQALDRFWARQGCLLVEAYDTEKGAGTLSPFTFFRTQGPEPWRVASVEPSRRPADARYGQNPNRLYRFHQYQVILKPSPPGSPELYLDSLRAVGIEARDHDIRFVEDNWEAPTQGAWGLGWEVWLDGLEISQFTYFQGMAGRECRPVTVEMTYGLERIAAYLQGVDSVFDVEYGAGLTMRELFGDQEAQQSAYVFEHADPERLARAYADAVAEAEATLALGLYVPAYDQVLHASHLFNVMDARGVLSVAQRTARIAEIRGLARRCGEAYEAARAALGHPLLRAGAWGGGALGAAAGSEGATR